jgi:regulatory protein
VSARAGTYVERRARADARRAERGEIEDPAVVLEAAAAFLAVRPRSVDETRRRLRHLGYPVGPVDVVIDRLLAFGYLDDAAFARTWVESRDRARPRGESALRRELMLKGIDREVVSEILAERAVGGAAGSAAASAAGDGSPPGESQPDDADEVAARHLLERRAASLRRDQDPRKRRQKAYALLARNGFDPGVCARVASAFFSDVKPDETGDEGDSDAV